MTYDIHRCKLCDRTFRCQGGDLLFIFDSHFRTCHPKEYAELNEAERVYREIRNKYAFD